MIISKFYEISALSYDSLISLDVFTGLEKSELIEMESDIIDKL